MDRYLLDLNNLPKVKREVILQVISNFPRAKALAFIKGLIFLGYSNLKQTDIDVVNAITAPTSTEDSLKYRILLSDTPVSEFLKTIPSKKRRRSCVYALLYAGVSSFVEFQSIITGSNVESKTLERIEKLYFLSGLCDYLNSNLTIEIGLNNSIDLNHISNQVENHKPLDVPSFQSDSLTGNNVNEVQVLSDSPPTADYPIKAASAFIESMQDDKPKSKKPIFNVDGV